MKKGILYALGAYLLWGFFPIYWKSLHQVSALQVIGHRIGWSLFVLIIFILLSGQWRDFRSVAFRRKTVGMYAISGTLLTINWLIYVYGVNAGEIVQTSLGYFINPLLSVLFGVVFLREQLRPAQWIPVILAAVGVIYLTLIYGRLPWIALALAFSFAFYGLVKKVAPLGSLYGLTLETGLVLPIALIYLIFAEFNGSAAFLHNGIQVDVLLAGAGIVTTIPLLLFASAARRIPLTTVGVLQYVAPTIQLLLGVLIYKEAFDTAHFIGFAMVWVALIIFGVEGFLAKHMQPAVIPELGKG